MEAQEIKPKLGRWLNIEEIKGFITETPPDIVEGIPINRKLLEIASEFVERQNGWWEHPDWESFLNILNSEGYNLSEEVQASIGSILEIFKEYYHSNGFETIIEKRRKPSAPKNSNPRSPKPKVTPKRAKEK